MTGVQTCALPIFSITSCNGVSEAGHSVAIDSGITDACFMVVGQKCSKLVSFSIAFNRVTNIGITALANGCPRLRSFCSHNCPFLDNIGILALSRGCIELRDIAISECLLITDDCLSSIAAHCPDLTSFTLSRSESVTDAGIASIAGGCPKLEQVSIQYCYRISYIGLMAVAGGCPDLKSLTISACGDISDKGLRALVSCCPKLQSVTMLDCPDISDKSVIAMAVKCSHLQKISFIHSKLSDASLLAFAKHSRELQSVYLSSCHNITSTGLSILETKCSQLHRFNLHECRNVKKENLLSLRRKFLRETSEFSRERSEHSRQNVFSMLRSFMSR